MIVHYVGPVGSGKTYMAVLQALASLEAGRDVATINLHFKRAQLEELLVERGMMRSRAHERVMRIRHIVNEEQFQSLKGEKRRWVDCFVDEASTWFPAHKAYDSFLDQTAVAMSRHNYVNLHIISQFRQQIHSDIRNHAEEVWRCYPMRFVPIPQVLAFVNAFRKLRGLEERPCLFMYVRGIASDGNQSFDMVKAVRANKRRVGLSPKIASVYATDEHLSNPVADRMGRRARLELQRQILAGTYLPSSPCPVCHGVREIDMCWMLEEVPAEEEFAFPSFEKVMRPSTKERIQSPDCLGDAGTLPCTWCVDAEGVPQGYYYPSDHPEILAAKENAHLFVRDFSRAR